MFAETPWIGLVVAMSVMACLTSVCVGMLKDRRARFITTLLLAVCCLLVPYFLPFHSQSISWWTAVICLGASLKVFSVAFLDARPPVLDIIALFIVPTATGERRLGMGGSPPSNVITRGLSKLAGLFAHFLLFGHFPLISATLFQLPFAKYAVALFMTHLVVSGFSDVLAGLASALTNRSYPDFCDEPWNSETPKEFWGRRWNYTFRAFARRCVYAPLVSRGLPHYAAAVGVYAVSALAHEYLVAASLGKWFFWWGDMTTFFALQAGITTVESLLSRVSLFRKLRSDIPRQVWVAMTMAWLVWSCQWFFDVAWQCIPFMEWRLVASLDAGFPWLHWS